MLNQLIDLLKSAKQSDYKFSASELSYRLGTSKRGVRLLVEDIRRENLIEGYVLVSGDEGYYLSNDSDEINRFLHRYLGAAFSSIKTAQNAKRFLSETDKKEIQMQLEF